MGSAASLLTGPFGDVWQQLSAAGFSPEQIAAQVNRMIDQQAFTRAADDVFFVSAILFIALIGMIWFAKPAKAGAAADAGGAH